MVSDSDSEEPGLVQAAKDLLRDGGLNDASAETTLRAVQDTLCRFHEHLRPRLGEGGFRAIVELAHQRAIHSHAVLETVVVESDHPRVLRPRSSRLSSTTEETLGAALVHLLAEVLGLIREVARDQDWNLVEIWPGLGMVREQGIPLKPGESSNPEPPDETSEPAT